MKPFRPSIQIKAYHTGKIIGEIGCDSCVHRNAKTDDEIAWCTACATESRYRMMTVFYDPDPKITAEQMKAIGRKFAEESK